MQNYKAPDNSTHAIEPAFAHMLPEGCIAITQEEADAIVASKVVPLTYQQLRAAAYPPLAEQLGAILKGGDAEAAMRATIQAVKLQYPKDAP